MRLQIEKLNDYIFTDDEWQIFFDNQIANKNENKLNVENELRIYFDKYSGLVD